MEKNVYQCDEIWDLFNAFNDKDIEVNREIVTENISNDSGNCRYCNSDELISDDNNGVIICQNCGKILDTIIDLTAEWRYYGVDDSKSSDPTRCGMPGNNLLPESSLGTVVGSSRYDSYEMRKIRKYHTWNAMPYKERSLYGVFDQLTIRAVNNGIPACIIEDAKVAYKTLSENKLSRASNKKGLIASCIYIACKSKGVPRSAKEVAEIFKIKITSMTKGCKNYMEIIIIANKASNSSNL